MANITIIGPGALGILFSVKLTQAGCSISLLDHRKERAERLNSSGIRLLERETEIDAAPVVTSSTAALPCPDYVLVLVKAYQTESTLHAIREIISGDTLVISLQNGVGTGEILERAVPARNIFLGTTTHGANLVSEDTAVHAGAGPTVLGPYLSGSDIPDRIVDFSDLLRRAGFETEVAVDIYPHLWRKLLINIGINPLTSLTGLKNGQLLDYPQISRIQEMAVREAFKIISLSGIDLDMTDEACVDMVRQVCRKTSGNRSSMLQDRLHRRRTEIEFISGAVLKKANQLGIKAPVNQVLTSLINFEVETGWRQFQNGS